MGSANRWSDLVDGAAIVSQKWAPRMLLAFSDSLLTFHVRRDFAVQFPPLEPRPIQPDMIGDREDFERERTHADAATVAAALFAGNARNFLLESPDSSIDRGLKDGIQSDEAILGRLAHRLFDQFRASPPSGVFVGKAVDWIDSFVPHGAWSIRLCRNMGR